MKNYKLLKDIPGVKAGAIFSLQSELSGMYFTDGLHTGYHELYLIKYPDFFEEVKELEKVFTIEDIYKAVEFGCKSCLTHDYGDETEKFIRSYYPQHIDQLEHLK